MLDEVREWQHRALDRMYPIVMFDALRVKIRDADSRMVKNKAVYIALGVTRDGEREVLGLWIADNEGANLRLGKTAFLHVVCSFKLGRFYITARELPGGRSSPFRALDTRRYNVLHYFRETTMPSMGQA